MKAALAKLSRRFIRSRIARTSLDELNRLSHRKLIRCFRRAASRSPAYRTLLAEAGVRPAEIRTAEDLVKRCPILEKSNTFHRFPLGELIAEDIAPRDIASIITSSGHGGSGYALGVGGRAQVNRSRRMIDLGLDLAFDIDGGAPSSSTACQWGDVSVRRRHAWPMSAFGKTWPAPSSPRSVGTFDQIILCGDPLFLKRLCDYSEVQRIPWGRFRVNAIIGEETFPEAFRNTSPQPSASIRTHPTPA
jgi:phenylacetate-CoA ligase